MNGFTERIKPLVINLQVRKMLETNDVLVKNRNISVVLSSKMWFTFRNTDVIMQASSYIRTTNSTLVPNID